MRPKNRKVRMFRALSGQTQRVFAREARLHESTLGRYELDEIEPSDPHMERMAQAADLTVPDGDRILELADALRQVRLRAGREGVEGLLREIRIVVSGAYLQLLRLPLPESLPRPEDRRLAGELWLLLKDLPEDHQVAVVRLAEEFQHWALAEICAEESAVQASRDLERAASLARLAEEIAARVQLPEGLRKRLRGLTAAHGANVARVSGELKTARAGLEDAKRLWDAGADPEGLLDPGRLLDLEASLLRDERRFEEALARLDEAFPVSRSPARILIKKGFTLEVMGKHERAIEALLQADALMDRETEPRLWYHQRFNLAVTYTHLGRHGEAADLVQQVRSLAGELGDEIFLVRVVWLAGRVAAGLGRQKEAQRLLGQARREFSGRSMSYDVALALLEEAALLLEEGRAAEVKELAGELTQVFEDKGVHRETLAALQLFQEAAEREAATAELARRVLDYLFRARYDQGLRFSVV